MGWSNPCLPLGGMSTTWANSVVGNVENVQTFIIFLKINSARQGLSFIVLATYCPLISLEQLSSKPSLMWPNYTSRGSWPSVHDMLHLTHKHLETNGCVYSALWLLMPWCWSTRPSVSTVLNKYWLYWISIIQNYYIYDGTTTILRTEITCEKMP